MTVNTRKRWHRCYAAMPALPPVSSAAVRNESSDGRHAGHANTGRACTRRVHGATQHTVPAMAAQTRQPPAKTPKLWHGPCPAYSTRHAAQPRLYFSARAPCRCCCCCRQQTHSSCIGRQACMEGLQGCSTAHARPRTSPRAATRRHWLRPTKAPTQHTRGAHRGTCHGIHARARQPHTGTSHTPCAHMPCTLPACSRALLPA
jgi:hypothetical protein